LALNLNTKHATHYTMKDAPTFTDELNDQLANCGKLPMFEIEVTDTDGSQDFILCDISINGDQMTASREAVSTSELESDKIASNSVNIDDCFSLDDHLQALHDAVMCSILEGDLFTY